MGLRRLRCGWRLTTIPSTCSCGSKMDIQHAVSFKKGGFITIRHNDLRNLTAHLLMEVCKDVDLEPQLVPVTGEESFNKWAANTRTKQGSLWNQGDSGWEVNRHFSIWEYLTQMLISTSTKHSLNSTSKMKR